ncbi:MAG: hypothetical protein HUU10_08890 [Bacteroidetes bacterium]|nr:hypothetical protein [Bacteroidota bacterium]
MQTASPAFQKFCQTITDRYGIVITRDQQDILARYVPGRMSYFGYQYFEDYLTWLSGKASETEWEQYISLITNNETYFFREPNHFRILDTQILDELLKQANGKRKVRLWSCGCSSGEEPYSLAMLVRDKYGEAVLRDQFEILASDLDQKILQSARSALYGRNSFRVKEHNYILSHFENLPTGKYQLEEKIKSQVRFFRYNVCEDMDKIPELQEPVDLVFFRNVSIYFTAETLKKVHTRIQSKLVMNGYLFVASCETMLHDIGLLKLTDHHGAFVFKKALSSNQPETVKYQPASVIPPKTDRVESPAAVPQSYEALLKHIRGVMDRRQATPSVQTAPTRKPAESELAETVTAAIRQNQEQLTDLAVLRLHEDLFEETLALLRSKKDPTLNDLSIMAYANLSLSRFDEAMELTDRMKKQYEFSPVGYLMEGLIHKLQSKTDLAIAAFRRSIYLDLNFATPHFHLGTIYQQTGKLPMAINEFELTLRLIDKNKKQLVIFNKPDVSLDYIQYVVQRLLKTIQQDYSGRVS